MISFDAGMAQDVYTNHGNVTTIKIVKMVLTNFIATTQQLQLMQQILSVPP